VCFVKRCNYSKNDNVVLGDVKVIVLAIVLKVRGFKPGRKQLIFKGDKNPYFDFLRRGR
jgi:hypothetical protein